MANPLDDIFDKVSDALQFVAESAMLTRELPANAGAARYVWEPTGGALQGANRLASNVQDTLALDVVIHCWGACDQSGTDASQKYDSDFDAAWHLFSALLTVLPDVMKGRNFFPGKIAVGKPGWIEYGISIQVPIVLRVEVMKAEIPTSGEPFQKIDDFQETTPPTPHAFEEVTPATSTPGDGQLEGTEP